LKFIVVDAATQKPIAGAKVRLRESDLPSPSITVQASENGIGSTTVSDGSLVLPWNFHTSRREGVLEHSGHIFFNNQGMWIQASAQGYETQLTWLESLTGMSRDIFDPIPPPMQILLVPEKAK
jgi:hypothetical protein